VAIARDAGEGVVVRAADDGRVLRTLEAGARRHTEVAWSADGRWLAVGDMSGETQLSRDDATQPVAILPGHRHLVAALAFTPDSGTLVTGSWDGDLRLWDLASIERDPDALLAEATGAWGTSAEALLGR
jgi:WD40 repeat protein